MKEEKINIKAFKSGTNRHEIYIYTNNGDFIASSHIQEIDNYFAVDGSLARKGYGKHLYNFMAMYAYENDKYLISDMEGDCRSGALKNWQRMYENKNYQKKEIESEYRKSLDWTNKEETPFLFHGIKIKPNEFYLKNKLDNEDVTHFLEFTKYKESFQDFFGIAYDNDSNDFLDKDYPLNRFKIDKILNSEPELEQKIKKTLKR